MSNHETTNRPVVLIGPVCDDPTESVSSVNKAFMEGLTDHYRFVAPSANRKHGNTQQARFNFWNLYYLFKHLLAWVWALLRHRPDIAHYGLTTGWALEKGLLFLGLTRACGARTIAHLHSGEFIRFWEGLSERRQNRASRELAKVDAFVVLSNYWKDVVTAQLAVPREKIHVVSNPLSAAFETEALRLPIHPDGATVLGLGLMGRDKGIFDASEAAATVRRSHPGFQLILAGPERDPGIVKEISARIQAASLSENIRLLSAVWGAAKLDLFRQSQILILPSYFENFPLVVLEAAAAGHAIITTPVGAIPEFFTDGVSALFVEPGNSSQLAGAIIRLLNNPEERCRLASAAREVFCTSLQKPRLMAAMDRIYHTVLGQFVPERSGALCRPASTGIPDSRSA